MADETNDTRALPDLSIPAANDNARPRLPIREIRIIPTHAKSPANEFVDIVEIELALPNDGNCDWMQWMDVLRLRCERGKADGLLKTMGLK
jgi:hypothetical protein